MTIEDLRKAITEESPGWTEATIKNEQLGGSFRYRDRLMKTRTPTLELEGGPGEIISKIKIHNFSDVDIRCGVRPYGAVSKALYPDLIEKHPLIKKERSLVFNVPKTMLGEAGDIVKREEVEFFYITPWVDSKTLKGVEVYIEYYDEDELTIVPE